jgi:uncharacterized membrane protein YfcA
MTTALLFCIVLGAFFTEAVAGFGSTVLTVAFGATLLPLDTLLPSFVPVGLLLSFFIVSRHRDAIDGRLLVRRILPFMLLGFPVGMFAFTRLAGEHERVLKLTFGALILALATLEIVRVARDRGTPSRPLPKPAAAALLAIGGAIHGAYSSGGPMVVYVLGRSDLDKRRFRSTLSTLWLGFGTLLLTGYLHGGRVDRHTLGYSALFAPAMLLGLFLGERAHDRVPARTFRTFVSVLLLFGGALLAWNNRPR